MTEPEDQLMKYFEYSHLGNLQLQAVSRIMYDAAWTVRHKVPSGPEKTAGLRKLLEAKDCFVRASLPQQTTEDNPPVRCQRNAIGLPCTCGQCTHAKNATGEYK